MRERNQTGVPRHAFAAPWECFLTTPIRVDVLGGSAEPMIGVDTMPDARTASAGILRVFQG
ncbi:MAG: hypothetical protein OEZ06_22565, partial [Myxococcales bacterium]|nr:hypothetical protein [Myxococcales bacterium]